MHSVLSPFLHFRRNLGRTLPMMFVIMLAVTLVASVASIVHSIDLTVYTLYGYNRYLTGMTPRNALAIAPTVIAKVRSLPELGPLYPAHSYQILIKTIFGKMPFPIFGLEPEARKTILQRCGLHLAAGRMPEEGQPEAVISEEIAKNLNLKIGDIIAQPNSEDSYAPVAIRLVGTLRGAVWLGLTSKSMVDANSPFLITGYLAFSPQPGEAGQRRLDDAIFRVVDKSKARVWRFAGLIKETRSALSNLYLIMNLVTGIIVFAISFVCGLLANIYFTQRLPEIATLSAIGYTRARLLRRAISETSLLCLLGWALGTITTIGFLWVVRAMFLAPKGLLLNPMDGRALGLTFPLPVTITLFAVSTIGLRLATLDPVSIIERRG